MAYIVSQMRKNNNENYMVPLATSLSPTTMTSPNNFGNSSQSFEDFALSGTFQAGVTYYLRFQVKSIPQYFYSGSKMGSQVQAYFQDADSLQIQVILKQDKDSVDEVPEIIGNCFVPTEDFSNISQNNKYNTYTFVFTPTKTYNNLGFKVGRVSFDAINYGSDINGYGYRTWLTDSETDVSEPRYTGINSTVQVSTQGPRIRYGEQGATDKGDFCRLTNLVSPASGWTKFGFQSRPGTLIVVNGEPIIVGRSGIYEIDNGTLIKSFMIAAPNGDDNSNIDAFLLDYAYQTTT